MEPARNPLGGSMELMTLSITSATEEENGKPKSTKMVFSRVQRAGCNIDRGTCPAKQVHCKVLP